MIVYISGKMTGLEDLGREAFDRAEQELKAAGHTVLNPAALPEGLPREAYMPMNMSLINAADAVYMLRSWPASRGACIEKDYAEYQGKRILYEDPAEGARLSACQNMMRALLARFGGDNETGEL